jgi:hypothetical protein
VVSGFAKLRCLLPLRFVTLKSSQVLAKGFLKGGNVDLPFLQVGKRLTIMYNTYIYNRYIKSKKKFTSDKK